MHIQRRRCVEVCVSPLPAAVLNGFPSRTCHLVINNAAITPKPGSRQRAATKTYPNEMHPSTPPVCWLLTHRLSEVSEVPGNIHHIHPPPGGGRWLGRTGGDPEPHQAAIWTHTGPRPQRHIKHISDAQVLPNTAPTPPSPSLLCGITLSR